MLDDLADILGNNPPKRNPNGKKLSFAGHSMGGGVHLRYANGKSQMNNLMAFYFSHR